MNWSRPHLSFVLLVTLTIVVTSSVRAEWANALKPTGPSAEKIVLVKDGKSPLPIRIPASATPIEKSAAAELQHWIEQITTARPEIVSTDVKPAIVLQTDPSLGEEGYRISVDDGNLVLSGGTTRGVVNAVYALLEEDLGCRFYTNESVRLPKSTTLIVEPVARSFIPKLRIRDPFYKSAFDPVWSLRNRTNSPSSPVGEEFGGHIDYAGLFVHTHAALLPPAQYFAEHPEYFALGPDGKRYSAQLCATNPEVAKLVTAAVLNVLKEHPHAEILSVSKNDNTGDQICHCENCKKVRAEEGGDIGPQLVLVNAVAEAVEKEYPHVVIDTLAYLETLQPPKHIRPRKNVVIRLCNDSVGSWVHPFTSADKCEIAKVITNWSSIQKRIYIWDYNVNFSHYLAPMPNVDVMAANTRFWEKNNAEGVMLQGGYQGPADGDELKSWVMSKVLWDPSRDERALVQDFIWGHYGAAAPAMAEYEELLNGLRTTYAAEMAAPPGGIRYPMKVAFLPQEFANKATEVLARAEQLAGGDETLLHRIERAELPILYVRCWRGPDFCGPDYPEVVAKFERIARREKVICFAEGPPNFEEVLAHWKSHFTKPPAAQGKSL